MAMLLVLLPPETEASLHPEAIRRLARLGITHLAVVSDGRSLGLLVEGWAFDPGGSADLVVGAVAGAVTGARALLPLAEMTLADGG
jgi:hypothetical protein